MRRAPVPIDRVHRAWARVRQPDGLHALRRRAQQRVDQVSTVAWHRYGPRQYVPPFDGDPRLAFVTVNFSTTRYLKLMLCTLGDQSALWFVRHVVIVDNQSRDGGPEFLCELAARVPRISLVQRNHRLSHANGLRAGIAALQRLEREDAPATRSNVIVGCDTDVVFRNPDALLEISAALVAKDGVYLGEARLAPPAPFPDMQASFFAFRRDAAARRDVHPLVNHGSPAFDMQASMVRAGLTLVDFPLHRGGYLLHRGRSGVAVAGAYHPRHSYARVTSTQAHYMGVPDGAARWAEIEDRWAPLLEPAAESALLDHLAERFAILGADAQPDPPG